MRRIQHRSLGNNSQRNSGKEKETQAKMEPQGPRSERAKNKGLISSPGALRGRCAITRSQRPWHKWKRQKQGPDPWTRKCLGDDGEAGLKKGQVNERGHTGSSRDQVSGQICLLMERVLGVHRGGPWGAQE